MPKKWKWDRIVTILSPDVNKMIKEESKKFNLTVSSFIKLLILMYYNKDMKIEIIKKSDIDDFLSDVVNNKL